MTNKAIKRKYVFTIAYKGKQFLFDFFLDCLAKKADENR